MWAIPSFEIGVEMAASAAVSGYLLGSIPFGLLLTRMAGLGDVRKIGSGNIGATNVLRTGNKALAAATLALDALKGTAAVWLAFWWGGPEAAAIAGIFAFLGHLFPIWLSFKGGKGVATYMGVMLGLAPWTALLFTVIWIATAFATRYSSLSALVATLAVPIYLLLTGHPTIAILAAIMSALVWIRHRANIARLMKGTESRLGASQS